MSRPDAPRLTSSEFDMQGHEARLRYLAIEARRLADVCEKVADELDEITIFQYGVRKRNIVDIVRGVESSVKGLPAVGTLRRQLREGAAAADLS